VLGVAFEQWLEGSVVGLVGSFAEPVEHVVSFPGPDGAELGVLGDVRRAGREIGLAFGDPGPDVGTDGQPSAVAAEGGVSNKRRIR
jgi:hypothetical protein